MEILFAMGISSKDAKEDAHFGDGIKWTTCHIGPLFLILNNVMFARLTCVTSNTTRISSRGEQDHSATPKLNHIS
jgi:hypothetical protein